MSGGGGSGPHYPRGGSTRGLDMGGSQGYTSDPERCSDIDEELRLQSPVKEVIAHLKPGDILTLVAQNSQPPVLAVNAAGEVAGSVVPSSLHSLIECIQLGFHYIATVLSITDGMCIVRITAAA